MDKLTVSSLLVTEDGVLSCTFVKRILANYPSIKRLVNYSPPDEQDIRDFDRLKRASVSLGARLIENILHSERQTARRQHVFS
jgi:hypothetical protein